MYRNISKIKIQNFQSHEYTIIDLDKNVNVIVGKTDSGKSAIIRALRWLFFNEPRGTDFIRTGTDEVIVELLYDDGYIVRRIRNKKVNGYEVEYNSNIETYYGIGTEVPEEIKKITGVRKIKFSENNEPVMINFQNQHDGAFMLNDSPAQKAKSIGYISNVNVIDEAIRKANQYELNAKQEKRRYELELENNEDELKKYDNLNEEIENLNIIKEKYEAIKEKTTIVESYSRLKNNLNEVSRAMAIGTEYIKKFDRIDKAIQLFLNLNKKWSRLSSHNNLLFQYRNNIFEINDVNKIIKSLESVEIYRDKLLELNSILNKFHSFNKISFERHNNEQEVSLLQSIIDNTNNLNDAKNNLLAISNKTNQVNNLKSSFNMLKDIESNINSIKDTIDSNQINLVSENYQKLMNLTNKYDSYMSISARYKSLNDEFNSFKNEYEDIEENIRDMLDSYLNYIEKSGICPLCGSVMDEEHLNKIKKEYGYEL